MTLQAILEQEQKNRSENGIFGIKACKDAIRDDLAFSEKYNKGETLFTLLSKYYARAKEDVFFNKAMVLACWELINEQ